MCRETVVFGVRRWGTELSALELFCYVTLGMPLTLPQPQFLFCPRE